MTAGCLDLMRVERRGSAFGVEDFLRLRFRGFVAAIVNADDVHQRGTNEIISGRKKDAHSAKYDLGGRMVIVEYETLLMLFVVRLRSE